MAEPSTIAAVDLGSNSFHCQIARVIGDQIYTLDSLREPVRLGAGLTRDKSLDESSQERALACLKRFGERLRGFDHHAVRAAGTNTLRVAKNATTFLKRAQSALGFPIEVIAGREEARLIYLGVAHGLPPSKSTRLVIDIGGGSTEFIIGRGHKPVKLESLFMGCVSYSLRFFPDGKVSKAAMKEAETLARIELQPILARYAAGNWDEALGSSGTVRALAEICELNGFSSGPITPEALDKLRAHLIKAGDMNRVTLTGIRGDRVPVLPGGLAILNAALTELRIDTMAPAAGAMRQGMLYDMLGRLHHHDMRDVTVAQFMQRYHVDGQQARRVTELAQRLYANLAEGDKQPDETAPQFIAWAAKLHEIGISVAYSGYHKHAAYIIANADMPGFSREEQRRLSQLVLGHRRSLRKIRDQVDLERDWRLLVALRLAVLFLLNRSDKPVPLVSATANGRKLRLALNPEWLGRSPLTVTALREEISQWDEIGFDLSVKAMPEAVDVAA